MVVIYTNIYEGTHSLSNVTGYKLSIIHSGRVAGGLIVARFLFSLGIFCCISNWVSLYISQVSTAEIWITSTGIIR